MCIPVLACLKWCKVMANICKLYWVTSMDALVRDRENFRRIPILKIGSLLVSPANGGGVLVDAGESTNRISPYTMEIDRVQLHLPFWWVINHCCPHPPFTVSPPRCFVLFCLVWVGLVCFLFCCGADWVCPTTTSSRRTNGARLVSQMVDCWRPDHHQILDGWIGELLRRWKRIQPPQDVILLAEGKRSFQSHRSVSGRFYPQVFAHLSWGASPSGPLALEFLEGFWWVPPANKSASGYPSWLIMGCLLKLR